MPEPKKLPLVAAPVLVLIAVAGAPLVTGCAAGAPAVGHVAEAAPPTGRHVVLLVRNDNWLHVNVYVIRAGLRYRLGTVSTMGREIFRIPHDLLGAAGTVELIADPVGSIETHSSEAIVIGRARQIEWTLAEHLPQSRVMLR